MKRLSNPELAALAVRNASINRVTVHTEYVAIELHKLAPQRFSWKFFSDQINLELVRRELTRASSSAHGQLVQGSHKTGWSLTQSGLIVAKRAERSKGTVSEADTLRSKHDEEQLKRILDSPALRKLRARKTGEITNADLNDLWRASRHMSTQLLQRQIDRVLRIASYDRKLSRELDRLSTLTFERRKHESSE